MRQLYYTERDCMSELKLFVFNNFCPDYTSGLAFAVAHDEVEARALIEKDKGLPVYNWGDLSIHDLNTPFGTSVSGGG